MEAGVHIQGVRIRNFKVLKNIEIGRLWDTQRKAPLTPLTTVIGRNGTGKSTLLDAFGFLADCLKQGVEEVELSAAEKKRFQEAVMGVYEKYCADYMDVIEQIIEENNE